MNYPECNCCGGNNCTTCAEGDGHWSDAHPGENLESPQVDGPRPLELGELARIGHVFPFPISVYRRNYEKGVLRQLVLRTDPPEKNRYEVSRAVYVAKS